MGRKREVQVEEPTVVVTVEYNGNTLALVFIFDNGNGTAHTAGLIVDPDVKDSVVEILQQSAKAFDDSNWQAEFPVFTEEADAPTKNGTPPRAADDIPF